MPKPTAEHPASVISKEGEISLEIRRTLDKLGIPNWRMQAGGYRGRAKGLKPGTADILATPIVVVGMDEELSILWIEVKKPGGKLSTEQLAFADRVRKRGHDWLCAESLDAVMDWLKENRAR